jgi:hypothetical protein
MYMHTMAARMVVPPGAPPIAQVPSHCPYYPHNPTAWSTPAHALVAAPLGLPVLMARLRKPLPARANAPSNPIQTHTSRGPPVLA